MSLSLVKYVLKAAIRDKLIIAIFVIMALASSLSVFVGSSAVVEQDQFTLVFASGGLRFTGVFGLVIFTVFFIRRSFESRDVEYLLSRPIGRAQFLFSYAIALTILALTTAGVQALCLYVLGPHYFNEGAWLWCFSIAIENIIMVNTALFFALFLSSAAVASMAVFALYILGRMMGQILGILASGGKAGIFEGLEYTMQMVSVLTPRLDLMGQSAWILYGPTDEIGYVFLLLQGVLFTGLLLIASLLDLVKRQF